MAETLRLQQEDDALIQFARRVTNGKTSKIGVVRTALREYINDNGPSDFDQD